MDEKKRLVREASPLSERRGRRGRVVRGEGRRPRDEAEAPEREPRAARGRRVPRDAGQQQQSIPRDMMELNKGALFVGLETLAAGADMASTVLRNGIDRAFSRSYRTPGDVVRGVTQNAGDAVHDVLGQTRATPQRLNDSFYEAVPPRNEDRGERWRRAQAERRRTASERDAERDDQA